MSTQSHCPVSPLTSAEVELHLSPVVRLPGDPYSSSGANAFTFLITPSRGRRNVSWAAQGGRSWSYRRVSTISKLPDEVLLEIFDFCRMNHEALRLLWKWHVLVHVCQRWRQIVFASPHRLNPRILCTYGTPVRKSLGIWPAFLIALKYDHPRVGIPPDEEDNVLAALEHPDRVWSLELNGTASQLENISTVMRGSFPVLTHLIISSVDGNAPVLSAEFLGGSAPCLEKISLFGIPYPTLPKLLLSARDLAKLYLDNIPLTGYISPEAMVACLIALPRLERLLIGFQLATPRPNLIHPPPITRTVLPSLTSFAFRGASEYLEDLVARIDSPQLNRVLIHYLNQLVDFHVTQFSRFIDHTVCPEFTLFKHAHVLFSRDWVYFTTCRNASDRQRNRDRNSPGILTSCQGIDWQVSHMAQVLSQISTTLSNIVHLSVWFEGIYELESMDDVEWLLILHHFSTVQTLYVTRQLAGHVARALEDITADLVAEVLPSLALIYLAGQPASSVEKFVVVRWLSGRPVTVTQTYAGFEKRRESHVSK